MRNLTQEERELLFFGLSMRAGGIETGDPLLRAVDADNSGQNDKIRALDRNQRDSINKIEDLQVLVMNNKLKIDE